MTIRVLLFAAYREAVGSSRLEVEVPEGATVSQVYDRLEQEHDGLARLRPYTSFAVNREFVDADAVLRAGDEVAFLQPVSGGA